jgi:hypothetical protein
MTMRHHLASPKTPTLVDELGHGGASNICQKFKVTRRVLPGVLGSKLRVTACRSIARGQEREARPLVVGCSTETGSDAGKVFLRASSSFLAPALASVAINIALTRFAFRIVHHVGFSDRAAGDALSR